MRTVQYFLQLVGVMRCLCVIETRMNQVELDGYQAFSRLPKLEVSAGSHLNLSCKQHRQAHLPFRVVFKCGTR